MPLAVSFVFGGISSEYNTSVSSLTHIISSYLSIPCRDRSFSVKNMYHLSRDDGLVRTIPFHNDFTISELTAYLSDTSTLPGSTVSATFDAIERRKEYVVNLLLGQFGEDGGVQTIAALSGLKGTFGDPQVASLTMNKYAMSSFVSSILPTDIVRIPKTTLVRPRYVADAIRSAKLRHGQIVVKPNSLGSSLFTGLFDSIAESEYDIRALLRTIFKYDSGALLQEFIPGDDYSCGCIITSSDIILLPVIKVETARDFFGYDEKSADSLAERKVVGSLDDMSDRLKYITKYIVNSSGLCSLARVDFKVTDQSEVWFLECNSIPSLTQNSLFVKMLHHHGKTALDLVSILASKSSSFKRKPHLVE